MIELHKGFKRDRNVKLCLSVMGEDLMLGYFL